MVKRSELSSGRSQITQHNARKHTSVEASRGRGRDVDVSAGRVLALYAQQARAHDGSGALE